jgi:tRNA-specific adenosine deaminase 2
MCAAAISMQGVVRVVYGCANDKFGGTGSIMNFHESSQVDGHLWNGYEVISGFKRDEAIQLFKQFYARSNQRAPVPKKRKEGDQNYPSSQDEA